MVFENLFCMIRALSRRSPHLTWILSCSSLGTRRTTHSLRGSFLTFRIHKSLHHLKFFFHLLVFCFKHLRCTHSKKDNSRINNLIIKYEKRTYFALVFPAVVLMPFLATAPGALLIDMPPTPIVDALKVPYPLLAVFDFILTVQVFKIIYTMFQLPL